MIKVGLLQPGLFIFRRWENFSIVQFIVCWSGSMLSGSYCPQRKTVGIKQFSAILISTAPCFYCSEVSRKHRQRVFCLTAGLCNSDLGCISLIQSVQLVLCAHCTVQCSGDLQLYLLLYFRAYLRFATWGILQCFTSSGGLGCNREMLDSECKQRVFKSTLSN